MNINIAITILLVSFFSLSTFASGRHDERQARRGDKRAAFFACAQANGLQPSRKLRDEMNSEQREKINKCLVSKGYKEIREHPNHHHRRSHDDRDKREIK